jgi:hypothetical protein
MGGIGKCILVGECVVSSVPMTKYVFGPSGYVALWAHFEVIWWLRVLADVCVRDWMYCVVCMGG